jgi:hypothetical protein
MKGLGEDGIVSVALKGFREAGLGDFEAFFVSVASKGVAKFEKRKSKFGVVCRSNCGEAGLGDCRN